MRGQPTGAGARSNRYSADKLSNWAEYSPWWSEVQAVFKRFDDRIAKRPKFPKVIELEPSHGFMRPCTAKQVESKLKTCPPEFLQELRAVFILGGTKKQSKCANGSIGFWGHYWRCCVFLHAPVWSDAEDLETLATFYLKDVLMHEIGHHVDERPDATKKEREQFAELFAARNG